MTGKEFTQRWMPGTWSCWDWVRSADSPGRESAEWAGSDHRWGMGRYLIGLVAELEVLSQDGSGMSQGRDFGR